MCAPHETPPSANMHYLITINTINIVLCNTTLVKVTFKKEKERGKIYQLSSNSSIQATVIMCTA